MEPRSSPRSTRLDSQVPALLDARIFTLKNQSYIHDVGLQFSNLATPSATLTVASTPLPPELTNWETVYTLISPPTIKNSFYFSFEKDALYFPSHSAFEAFFDSAVGTQEYPDFNQPAHVEYHKIFDNVRFLALGGDALPPFLLETLSCFKKLASLKIDARCITATDPATVMDAKEVSTASLELLFSRNGFQVPMIEWVWDLGYWLGRYSVLPLRDSEILNSNTVDRTPSCQAIIEDLRKRQKSEDDENIFESKEIPKRTQFVEQCLKNGQRSYLPDASSNE